MFLISTILLTWESDQIYKKINFALCHVHYQKQKII